MFTCLNVQKCYWTEKIECYGHFLTAAITSNEIRVKKSALVNIVQAAILGAKKCTTNKACASFNGHLRLAPKAIHKFPSSATADI